MHAMKSYTYLDQAPLLEVDVHEGLENTLVIMQHKLKPGVAVSREYSPDLPRIEAYASELNQVWTNIIHNAIDAMNGKGQLTLRTHSEDDQVIVEITDNGPGIPADQHRLLFEKFQQLDVSGGRRPGTGLGLHFCKLAVEAHGGKISVESNPSQGSTFVIQLPVGSPESCPDA